MHTPDGIELIRELQRLMTWVKRAAKFGCSTVRGRVQFDQAEAE
jgi:hypothetical protein